MSLFNSYSVKICTLAGLVIIFTLAGCSGSAGRDGEIKEIRKVTHKDMQVEILKVERNHELKIDNQIVHGFNVSLKLKDLKGRPVGADNYRFLAPIEASDERGNIYENKTISVFDRDAANNPFPAGQCMIKLFFTPDLDPQAKRLNLVYKIQPVFFYDDVIIRQVKHGEGVGIINEQLRDYGLRVEEILIDRELEQLIVFIVQNDEQALEKKLSINSHVVTPEGKITSATGIGSSPPAEEGETRYQLNFPLEFSPEKPFDIVLKWVPRDEVWEFPLKNVSVEDPAATGG